LLLLLVPLRLLLSLRLLLLQGLCPSGSMWLTLNEKGAGETRVAWACMLMLYMPATTSADGTRTNSSL
jgi:hypothetical protein